MIEPGIGGEKTILATAVSFVSAGIDVSGFYRKGKPVP